MPGLFGFCGPTDSQGPEELLQSMARALEPEARFRTEFYQEAAFGMGRTTLGILNPEAQPVWNADRSVGLLLEGELFGVTDLKKDLASRLQQGPEVSDAELLLNLYEVGGPCCLETLNGAFAVAIWERAARTLIVAVDRMGSYPMYYGMAGRRLLFASGLRSLLADGAFSPRVDKGAVTQLLVFDHLLGESTLLAGASRLAPGSMLTYDGERLDVKAYWTPQFPEAYELHSEVTWMERMHEQFARAMARQNQGQLSKGVLLSGGLDSRVILARLCEASGPKPEAFTWGMPGCDDLHYARELARALSVPHHFFPLREDWLLEKAEEAVRRTDGQANIFTTHALATAERVAAHAPIVYKGYLGDALLGFSLRYQHWANYDAATNVDAHHQVHRDQGVINFEPEDLQDLLTDAFRHDIDEAPWDKYQDLLIGGDERRMAQQRVRFSVAQRTPRMALNGVELVRGYAAVRLPFCDAELVDFALTIPPGLLYERRLVRNTFVKYYPQLAQIPETGTGLPMMACMRDVLLRAEGLIRWRLNHAGLKWISYPRHRPYQDYNGWLRTVLRPWLEATLLSNEALDRGYFDPDYLRNLVAEQMAGANHANRLGALMSIELWHRQFLA